MLESQIPVLWWIRELPNVKELFRLHDLTTDVMLLDVRRSSETKIFKVPTFFIYEEKV